MGLEQAEASGAASQRGETVRECQHEAHWYVQAGKLVMAASSTRGHGSTLGLAPLSCQPLEPLTPSKQLQPGRVSYMKGGQPVGHVHP